MVQPQPQSGIINRIGNDIMLNWQYIEAITYEDETSLIIYFVSGNSIKLNNKDQIIKVMDLVAGFPDITNDLIRGQIKSAASQSNPNIKTDIPDPRLYPGVLTEDTSPIPKFMKNSKSFIREHKIKHD